MWEVRGVRVRHENDAIENTYDFLNIYKLHEISLKIKTKDASIYGYKTCSRRILNIRVVIFFLSYFSTLMQYIQTISSNIGENLISK